MWTIKYKTKYNIRNVKDKKCIIKSLLHIHRHIRDTKILKCLEHYV